MSVLFPVGGKDSHWSKYSPKPLISTLCHSIKRKGGKGIRFPFLEIFGYVMMTKSQRVEKETSHGFEKMRLRVVSALRMMFPFPPFFLYFKFKVWNPKSLEMLSRTPRQRLEEAALHWTELRGSGWVQNPHAKVKQPPPKKKKNIK